MTAPFSNQDEFVQTKTDGQNAVMFPAPSGLQSPAALGDFVFERFDEAAAVKHFDFFHIRPNKSYNSVPLDCFVWSASLQTECCVLDARCFLMRETDGDSYAGCTPFCREEELPYYFKLQERYYNQILHAPFRAFLQDSEGIEYLRSVGALDNYEITEDPEIFDYIYSGEDLRTLAGRRFAKKRNHIHKFDRDYGGRWEYRRLGYENREEILRFLHAWDEHKQVEGGGVRLGKEYDVSETLEIDVQGAETILNSPALMAKIRAGGIYVDGELCAFSIGSYNPAEKMAVIEIEKANPNMDGLYQVINREFLLHEFPEAEFVNREDDVGIPGLRQSKMSYNPILFEKRYTIIQKDFPAAD